jgi:hypothetical protein
MNDYLSLLQHPAGYGSLPNWPEQRTIRQNQILRNSFEPQTMLCETSICSAALMGQDIGAWLTAASRYLLERGANPARANAP